MSLLLGRRQKQMTVHAPSPFWNSFPLVWVRLCVSARTTQWGERMGEECYWSYYGDSISASPSLQPTSPSLASSASLPHFLTRTKKQIFRRGIPSDVGAAPGFANWSERGLGENVFPSGDCCSDMHPHRCAELQSYTNTMIISTISTVLGEILSLESRSSEWKVDFVLL